MVRLTTARSSLSCLCKIVSGNQGIIGYPQKVYCIVLHRPLLTCFHLFANLFSHATLAGFRDQFKQTTSLALDTPSCSLTSRETSQRPPRSSFPNQGPPLSSVPAHLPPRGRRHARRDGLPFDVAPPGDGNNKETAVMTWAVDVATKALNHRYIRPYMVWFIMVCLLHWGII